MATPVRVSTPEYKLKPVCVLCGWTCSVPDGYWVLAGMVRAYE